MVGRVKVTAELPRASLSIDVGGEISSSAAAAESVWLRFWFGLGLLSRFRWFETKLVVGMS